MRRLRAGHFRVEGRPAMPHKTVERLRAEIDRGRARDKVAGLDPATAPLGTDEEAAGTPLTAQQVAETRRLELSRPRGVAQTHGLGHAWLLVGFIVIFSIVLVAWGMVSR
jgi:hypothetical protein